MQTDEEIRLQFHDRLDTVLADVAPSPDILSVVRRAHRRRRQLLGSLVVVAAGSATTVTILAVVLAGAPARDASQGLGVPTPTGSTAAPAPPSPTVSPGPTVRLFGYAFSLPPGLTVTHRSGVIDLGKARPPQPVAGKDASFSARGPSGATLDVTVYRGPIAAAEAAVKPPNPAHLEHTKIAGHPASLDPYAGGTMLEIRVRVSADQLILLESEAVPRGDLITMLRTALT